MQEIRISIPSMFQPFSGCSEQFVSNICHGKCCRAGSTGFLVLTSDAAFLERKYGVETVPSFFSKDFTYLVLVADIKGAELEEDEEGKYLYDWCPFQDQDTGHCRLHNEPKEVKPFGCSIAPFGLNAKDLLIVTNRYRLKKCFKAEPKLPAYIAFPIAINYIFHNRAEDFIKKLEEVADTQSEFSFPVPDDTYKKLRLMADIGKKQRGKQ